MKTIEFLAKALLVMAASMPLARASDPTAVHARVERVVMEPNPDSPETIQVWGIFFADYLGMLGLRNGPWKFIYELDSGRLRLFNVERDTQEKINLSDCYVEQARWYVQDLRSGRANQK